MGKLFFLMSDEQPRARVVMNMSQNRSVNFYKIAEMLAEKLGTSSGLIDQSQQDEFLVDGPAFTRLLELFMKQDWEGEGVENLWNWAEFAAGMISNITLEPRFWKNRHHSALYPIRYQLWDKQPDEELSRKITEFNSRCKKFPKEPHPNFNELDLESYACIIEQTRIKTNS